MSSFTRSQPRILIRSINGSPCGEATASTANVVTIVHISDTHNVSYDGAVPDGDILIHSGDFTDEGLPDEVAEFRAFLSRCPHRHKVVLCGNHERGMDKLSKAELQNLLGADVIILHDEGVNLLGINIYGCPWNNSSQAWGATEAVRAQKYQLIPADTDVLVTHIPPFGVLDLAWDPKRAASSTGVCPVCSRPHRSYGHWGCGPLLARTQELRTPLHLFGHVHDDVGVRAVGETVYSNAAMDIYKRPCVFTVAVPAPAPASAKPAVATGEAQPVPEPHTYEGSSQRGSGWPFTKHESNCTNAGPRRPRAILLSTGALNPVHCGHLSMLSQARAALQQRGFDVTAGFLSPSHDQYVQPKMRHTKPVGVPLAAVYADAAHRRRLVEAACASSDWIDAAAWESTQSGFVDFPDCLAALHHTMRDRMDASAGDRVFYVCGADHYLKCGLERGIRLRGEVCGVVVVPRSEEAAAGATATLVSTSEHVVVAEPPSDSAINSLSSSSVRRRLLVGESIEGCVPPAVLRDLTVGKGSHLYRA